MNRITFANPYFLYLLLIIPALVAFYILKQHKASASLRVPGLQSLEKSGTTFRNYLRHILFAIRMIAVLLLIIVLATASIDRQISGCFNRRNRHSYGTRYLGQYAGA